MAEQFRAVVPDANTQPVRVFAQDERRIGLHTIRRRRITARGTKPVGTVQHDDGNCWVYGCVAPVQGDHFFLVLPQLNAAQMQLFVDEFAHAYPDTFNSIVLDNSRAHTTKRLRLPANIAFVFQPVASPELNPIERVWHDLKGQFAWKTFANLAALQDALVERLANYDTAQLRSLTSYAYFLDACHAVCS